MAQQQSRQSLDHFLLGCLKGPRVIGDHQKYYFVKSPLYFVMVLQTSSMEFAANWPHQRCVRAGLERVSMEGAQYANYSTGQKSRTFSLRRQRSLGHFRPAVKTQGLPLHMLNCTFVLNPTESKSRTLVWKIDSGAE